MEVPHSYPLLEQVLGEVLSHLLGQSGNQGSLVGLYSGGDHLPQVVDLPLGGSYLHLRVDQTGWAHNLFDHPAAVLQLPAAGSGRDQKHLSHPVDKFVETQRSVIGCRRKAEAVLDEGRLPASVGFILPVELRYGDV